MAKQQNGGDALEVRSGHHLRSDQQEWSLQNNGTNHQLLTVVGSLDHLFFYYNRSGQILICMSYSSEELLPMSLQATLQQAFNFYQQNKLVSNQRILFRFLFCLSIKTNRRVKAAFEDE